MRAEFSMECPRSCYQRRIMPCAAEAAPATVDFQGGAAVGGGPHRFPGLSKQSMGDALPPDYIDAGAGYSFSKARIRLAGLPSIVAPSETREKITEPEAMVTLVPTLTPCKIVDPEPIRVSLPI